MRHDRVQQEAEVKQMMHILNSTGNTPPEDNSYNLQGLIKMKEENIKTEAEAVAEKANIF